VGAFFIELTSSPLRLSFLRIIQHHMKISPEFKTKLAELGSKFGIKLSADAPATPIQMMAEAKLKDGTTIHTPAESWAEGVECYVMDADGNPQPAPDGDYILEDGSTLSVASGKVSAMKPAEAGEEMTSEQLAAMVGEFEKKLTSYNDELSALKAKLSETETKLSAADAAKNEAAAKIAELNTEITKLSKQPAAQSVRGRAGEGDFKPTPPTGFINEMARRIAMCTAN